jgi:hypothetical protein
VGREIPPGRPLGGCRVEHGLFGQVDFGDDRGVEEPVEFGARNAHTSHGEQISHESIGEALVIHAVLANQCLQLHHLLARQFREPRVPELDIQRIDALPVQPLLG